MSYHLDKSNDYCQPCRNFKRKDPLYGTHQCMACGGTVHECSSCGRDHHDGGWSSCLPSILRLQCGHVACKRLMRAQFPREIEGTP